MLIEQIHQLGREAGLSHACSSQACEQINQYFGARAAWNQTHNIAGPQAVGRPYEVDLIDGLALAQVLPAGSPLYDVGSGSGTPGLLVACLRPDLEICLVEPIAKRTAFLRHVSRLIGLRNLKVTRARWPVALSTDCQVVSRAVVDPAKWPALAVSGGPHVRTVVRMMAANRPVMTVEGFVKTEALAYEGPESSQRLIEVWNR
ncbi:MAG: 16S rRNA (guanine(527)-N(7))-methyltransferase RsmG [Bradymonadia bacterium]